MLGETLCRGRSPWYSRLIPQVLVVLFALSGKGITEHPFRFAEVNGGISPRSKRSQGGLPL